MHKCLVVRLLTKILYPIKILFTQNLVRSEMQKEPATMDDTFHKMPAFIFAVYLALISTKLKANNTFAFISMGKQNMQMDSFSLDLFHLEPMCTILLD